MRCTQAITPFSFCNDDINVLKCKFVHRIFKLREGYMFLDQFVFRSSNHVLLLLRRNDKRISVKTQKLDNNILVQDCLRKSLLLLDTSLFEQISLKPRIMKLQRVSNVRFMKRSQVVFGVNLQQFSANVIKICFVRWDFKPKGFTKTDL